MPLGADHFANAAAAVQRGVAVALEAEVDARSVQAALARVLTDPDLRGAAAAVAEEIAAMPSAAAAADAILTCLGERSTAA
jgi:UDP:flavonoid glycosyltransferase YjiC (YdhE family)